MNRLEQRLHIMLNNILEEQYQFPSWVFPRGESLASLMEENDNIMYNEEIKDLLDALSNNELAEIYNTEYYCSANEADTIEEFKNDLADYGCALPDELVDRQAELLEESELAFKEESEEGASNV